MTLLVNEATQKPATLTDAIRSGNTDKITSMLQSSLFEPSLQLTEALASACERKDKGTVTLLLKEPRINPVHPKCMKSGLPEVYGSILVWGDLDVFNLLIQHEAFVKSKVDPRYHFAFAFACYGGHTKLTESLLKRSLFSPSTSRQEALEIFSLTCNEGRPGTVRVCLQDKRFDFSRLNGSSDFFHKACFNDEHWFDYPYENMGVEEKKNRAEVVKLLLKDGRFDPNIDNSRTLHFLYKHGEKNIVRILLTDNRVNVSAQNNFVLRQACYWEDFETINAVLKHPKFSPGEQAKKAVEIAKTRKTTKLLERLRQDKRFGLEQPKDEK